MKSKLYVACLATIAILAGVSAAVNAADVRVLPSGQVPNDRRLGPLKELSGHYFPFEVPTSRHQWEKLCSRSVKVLLSRTSITRLVPLLSCVGLSSDAAPPASISRVNFRPIGSLVPSNVWTENESPAMK